MISILHAPGALWLAVLVCACLYKAPLSMAEQAPSDFVVPLPSSVFVPERPDAKTRRLMHAYHAALVRWDDVLLTRFQPVPGMPGCGYLGSPGNEENDIRPLAYAAAVNAFLTRAHQGEKLPAKRIELMRQHALATIEYLSRTHTAVEGKCLNGKPWGNQWQSAMWACSTGLAAWLMWDDLSADAQMRVSKIVEFEADRFLRLKPKSSINKDTGAEENAWNAQILSLACNMMARHPRAREWDQAAKLWMYNSLSAPGDALSGSIGDDGIPLSEWVQTTNVNADFTVENHGFVHVGYLKTSISLLLENALPYCLAGAAIPRACMHNAPECFDVLLRSMSWDASPIYYSGNDWKLVHTQPTDVAMYGMMSLLRQDRRASRLEEVALDYVRKIQKAEGGYFNIRRDLESGGLCAIRMITACLLHAKLGSGVRALNDSQLNTQLAGVWELEAGKVILHRRLDSFASFSWGAKRMALTLPKAGTWVIWPHFDSYIGQMDQTDSSAAKSKLTRINRTIGTNCFSVIGTLVRFGGTVTQDFSFWSMPNGTTIYLERVQAQPGFQMQSRETGIVGLEYPLGENTRKLYVLDRTIQTVGLGGEKPRILTFESDWLNIGNEIGYVVRRQPGKQNLMRFHDEVKGSGRVPKLQEWISLVGEKEPGTPSRSEDWACVVTFPNQAHRQTRAIAKRVQFQILPETSSALIDYGCGSPLKIRFD